jgi:hypothetical protein
MPMRFQSLDLNMGDNYVDKHRQAYTLIKVGVLNNYKLQNVDKGEVMKLSLREILGNPHNIPDTWLYLPSNKAWDLDTLGVFSEDSKDYPSDSDEYIPKEAKEDNWIEVLDKQTIEDVIDYTRNQVPNPTLEQLLKAFMYYYKNDAFLDFQ